MVTKSDYHNWDIPEVNGDEDKWGDYLRNTLSEGAPSGSDWESLDTEVINKDTYSNRPSAGTTGRWFLATDQMTLYYDNGTSWDTIVGQNMGGQNLDNVGEIHVGDGTAADPNIAFENDVDTGLYRPGAGRLGLVTNGVRGVEVDAAQNALVPNGHVNASAGFIAGSDIRDDASTPVTIYDRTNQWVPISTLEANTVTVAGNAVTLGGSIAVSAHDLSDSGSVGMLDEAETVTAASPWTFNPGLVTGSDITDDASTPVTIYDRSNQWVPLSTLEANTVTVAGNSVTLGGSVTPTLDDFGTAAGNVDFGGYHLLGGSGFDMQIDVDSTTAGSDADVFGMVFTDANATADQIEWQRQASGADALTVYNATAGADIFNLMDSGNLDVGNPDGSGESSDQSGSTYAGDGYVGAAWMYTNVVEADSERGSASTSITIGSSPYTVSDQIGFVEGGTLGLTFDSGGLNVSTGTISESGSDVLTTQDQSVVASGNVQLSSGSATISTGVTTSDTDLDVSLDPSGAGNNTGDVSVAARVIWKGSLSTPEYQVEILEDGTSKGNPYVGYTVVQN